MELKKKLQIKEGMRGCINALPQGIELGVTHDDSGHDFAVVFVKSQAEIEASVAGAIERLREDGMLWYCYPKKSSGVNTDIHRDRGWESLSALGWKGVRQIAIDSTWSALRFRDRRFVNQ